jgi:hypothetical protein
VLPSSRTTTVDDVVVVEASRTPTVLGVVRARTSPSVLVARSPAAEMAMITSPIAPPRTTLTAILPPTGSHAVAMPWTFQKIVGR